MMNDMPYQAISIEQTDVNRKYLAVNEEQTLSEQEKNQAVANLGLKSWIDSTYPDLAGGNVGSQGVAGENGYVIYSQGLHCVLYSGKHLLNNIELRGSLRVPSIYWDGDVQINLNMGIPILSFGTEDLPPRYSATMYSDGWMLNVGMAKELISTYGGEGSSLSTLTEGYLNYYSESKVISCQCPIEFSSDADFYSDTHFYGNVYFEGPTTYFLEPVSFSGIVYCYSDVSCMGNVSFSNTASFQKETVFYDRMLVYSELYFSGSNSDTLYVSGNNLYFNGKKVLTEA